MKLKILAVIALAAVGVGAAFVAMGGLPTSAANASEFLTSPATTGDVTDDVAATGTLATADRYGLAFGAAPYRLTEDASAPTSEATWPVTDVSVAVGDTVKKGDTLATASTRDLRRELTAARNDLDSARVNLRAAETTLEEAEDADVTAQIRQAKIGLNSAQNQVAQAMQAVTDLRSQIRAATLVAPIDGVVTTVNIEAGLDAPSGDAVTIDSTTYEITTDVVESDLASIKTGQTAAVTIDAIDADVTGTVSAISPVAGDDDGSGVVSFPVTVTLTEVPATARAGMSADVTITVDQALGVVTVPAAALRGSEGDYSVLVMGADGQTTARAVQVGLVTNAAAEITSGLDEGEAVVTGTTADRTGTDSAAGAFPGGGVAIPGEFRRGTGGGPGPNVVIENRP